MNVVCNACVYTPEKQHASMGDLISGLYEYLIIDRCYVYK